MSEYITFPIVWFFLTLLVVLAMTLLSRKIGEVSLISLYSVFVIISAVTATKLITIFGFIVPAGVVVYAASFTVTDILSECFGKKFAIRAVWLGFFAMILYSIYALVTVYWPPFEFWPNQEAYKTIISSSIRVTLAGLVAFLVSQFNDVTIFHFLMEKAKKNTDGKTIKYLWLRNNVSTLISQFFDTIVFITIAFYGVVPNIIELMIGQYIIKVIIALLDTPFVYGARYIINKGK